MKKSIEHEKLKIIVFGKKDPLQEKVLQILNNEGIKFYEVIDFLKDKNTIKSEEFSAGIIIHSSGMDLEKTISSIKDSETYPELSLIIIANPKYLKIEEAFKAGADDYIEKSRIFEDLIPRLFHIVVKTRLFIKVKENALQLKFLYEASAIFNSSLDIDVIMEQVLRLTVKITESVSGTVFLTDSEGNVIKKILSRKFESDEQQSSVVEKIMKNGLAGWVYLNREPVMINNTEKDKRWIIIDNENSAIKSVVCLPIIRHENVLGLLTLHHTDQSHYHEEHLEILEQITNQVAISIENSKIFNQLHYLSMTDELTDLFNRRLFFTLADKEYFKATMFNEPLSLIMIDIDNFKKINDIYGHLIGDQILKKVAKIFKSFIRDFDILARYGGDEFVILLPRTDIHNAIVLSKKILKEFRENEIEVDGRSIKVTNSIGIAEVQEGCKSFSDLLGRADKALYLSKLKGKNRMDVYY